MLGIHILEYNPPFRGVDRANVTSLKLHFKKLLSEMVLKKIVLGNKREISYEHDVF